MSVHAVRVEAISAVVSVLDYYGLSSHTDCKVQGNPVLLLGKILQIPNLERCPQTAKGLCRLLEEKKVILKK